MHQAALDHDLDPDRLSFVRSLRVVRRHLVSQAVFPPDQVAEAARLAIGEILAEPLPRRRLRAFPRVVKRKMSNYGVKRAAHRRWPPPTKPPAHAVVILSPTRSCRSP